MKYAIKKPSGWFWKTNVSREDIESRLMAGTISGEWLVCPLGDGALRVEVSKFLADPTILDLRSGRSGKSREPTRRRFIDIPRQDAPQGEGLMIRVERLTHVYPGSKTAAVHELTFDVGKGEVFGFLGPSGAGKTTTQNVLIGLLRGWKGNVQVLDQPLGKWGADYYKAIGVSFELPNHYLKLTARENLEYFRALYNGKADSVREILEIVGLEADIDKPVGEFSKGMKNRLNLAWSLLHRPQLWFLDEPTSGLDPVNAVRVRELIRQRQSQGVTTVVTTHDMTTAEAVCDRVAFIVDGEIAAIDSPESLRRRFGKREIEVRWEGGDVERYSMDGLADNGAFLDGLRRPGLVTLHSQEATLEDVFLEVTGRSLQ